jgi:uncharacterized protein YkwD
MSKRAPLATLLLVLATACGGADPALETSRRALARGDLERAAAALEEADGPAADAARAELGARLAAHEAFEAELERLAELEPEAESAGLDALEARADDPALRERLEIARSAAADRAAEWRTGAAGRRREAERREEQRREREAFAAARAEAEEERLRAEEEARQRSELEAQRAEEVVATGGPAARPARPDRAPRDEEATPPVEPPPTEPSPARPAVADRTPAPSAPASPAAPEPRVTELDVLRPELEREERALVRARADRRDEAAAALLERGEVGEPFLKRAVEARWGAAVEELLEGSTLKGLAKLAQDREELDHRRELALGLIFDEEEYFYPYRPPECPPEKARLYWPVQQRVDELVAGLREAWDRPSRAKISSDHREALEELAWCRAQQELCTLVFDLSLPAELPDYALLVRPDEATLELRDFCWDGAEYEGRAQDRAVRARNLALWEAKAQEGRPEEQRAAAEERRQVEITNEYRLMFGRRRLAWNPRLQAATELHSAYMAETGNFGHFEEDRPETRTPFDRMRLCGYTMGISENCHMGGGGPEGAHEGWTHSSGHHRNLLMPGHREMATGHDSGYWTQNFGTDTSFLSDLERWPD